MSKYINYDAIDYRNDRLHDKSEEFLNGVIYMAQRIEDAPSIDIVRCAECVYCNIQNTKYLYAICERHGIEFKPFEDDTRTHGCTWGERKESE